MANDNENYDFSFKRLNDVALAIFSDLSSYQDHKENMANGGFLFEVALLSGFVAKHDVLQKLFCSEILLILSFSFIWIIAHTFIRWQMRAKKDAALKQNGILISMSKWVHTKPSPEDFKADERTFNLSSRYKIYNFIDRFFPMPNPNPPSYLSERKYPKGLVDGIEAIYKLEPTVPLTDYLYFLASVVILIIAILFT